MPWLLILQQSLLPPCMIDGFFTTLHLHTMIDRAPFVKRTEERLQFVSCRSDDHGQQRFLKPGSNWPHGGRAPIQPQQQRQKPLASTLAPAYAGPGGAEGRRIAAMMDPLNRTKVVVRHLPPSLSQSSFLEQIESRLACLYNWITFYPGKLGSKGTTYSHAYIDFKRPEYVFKFHDTFEGHMFVNEKGTQYRALVEYAPYQRVPKPWAKKDVREGAIFKDPEFLVFLELLTKPVEYLPSAEVQLERKEAERNLKLAAGPKEGVIVTPLMEYVRQKRALKSAPQRLLATSGKLSARVGVSSLAMSSSMLPKRRAVRSRTNAMYLPSQVTIKLKEKSSYVPRQEEKQHQDRESLVDKKRRESVEVREKKLGKEASSPKGVWSNQVIDAFKDSGDINKKGFPEIFLGPDTIAAVMDDSTIDQPGSRGVLAGKISSNVNVTTDLGNEGRDQREVSKNKVLLVKEKDESSYGPASRSSMLISDTSRGAHTSRYSVTSSRKSSGGSSTAQQGLASPCRGGTFVFKPSQRHDVGWQLGRGASSSRESAFQKQWSPVQPQLDVDQPADKDKLLSRPRILKAVAKEFNSIPVSTSPVSDFGLFSQQVHVGFATLIDKREIAYIAGIERQDGRRVRNKDRPDRPVWTVRRHADISTGLESKVSLGTESSSSSHSEIVISPGSCETNAKLEKNHAQFQNGVRLELGIKGKGGEPCKYSGQQENCDLAMDSVACSSRNLLTGEMYSNQVTTQVLHSNSSQDLALCHSDIKSDVILLSRSSDMKTNGTSGSVNVRHENGDSCVSTPPIITDKERRKQEALKYWNELGGNQRQSRRDGFFQHGSREFDSSIVLDSSKPAKRGGGLSPYGTHEKQVWVAKSGSGS